MARSLVLALAVAATLLAAPRTGAQSPSPFSIEASVGRGVGWTGAEYAGSQSGIAADVLLAMRLRPAGSGALIVGLSGSAQGTGASTSDCRPASTGGCVPRFPEFYSVAPLAGWESGRGTLRALLGPTLMQASREGRALGVQGRLDLAIPLAGRIAPVVSIRPAFIPDYRGDAIGLMAFGLGLRFR